MRVAVAERLHFEAQCSPERYWTHAEVGKLVTDAIASAGYSVVPGTCLEPIKDLLVDVYCMAREIIPAERRCF